MVEQSFRFSRTAQDQLWVNQGGNMVTRCDCKTGKLQDMADVTEKVVKMMRRLTWTKGAES